MGLVYLLRRSVQWPALRAPLSTAPSSPLAAFPLQHYQYAVCKSTTHQTAFTSLCALQFQSAATSSAPSAANGIPGAVTQEEQQPLEANSWKGEEHNSVQEKKNEVVELRFPLSLERRWDEVYCSDLCLQLDRLILSCTSADEVLRIVASHRGAFFVKNLVSALKHLAALGLQPSNNANVCTSATHPQQRPNGSSSSSNGAAAAASSAATPFPQLSLTLPSPPTWPQEPLSLYHFFSALSGDEAAVERSLSQRKEVESIVRDPRYMLLVQDLRLHRNVLTFAAAADVVLSLRALNHPHYPLLSALLPAFKTVPLPPVPPLYQQEQQKQHAVQPQQHEHHQHEQPDNEVEQQQQCEQQQQQQQHELQQQVDFQQQHLQQLELALSVAEAYVGFGYKETPLFEGVQKYLQLAAKRILQFGSKNGQTTTNNSIPPFTETTATATALTPAALSASPEAGEAPGDLGASLVGCGVHREFPFSVFPFKLLCSALFVFSRVALKNDDVFRALCLHAAANMRVASAAEVAAAAEFAAAGAPHAAEVQACMHAVAEELLRRTSRFSLKDMCVCFAAFTQCLLHFPDAAAAAAARAAAHLSLAAAVRQRAVITPGDICSLLRSICFFSPDTAGLYAVQESPNPQDNRDSLLAAAAHYLEEHIDCTSPEASLDALLAISASAGAPAKHSYWIWFLIRKLAQGTSWEKRRPEVFWIFMSQQLLFPPLDYQLPLRCIHESLRAWCMSRGGFSVEFREEVAAVSSLLKSLGVLHKTAVVIGDSPLPVDILIPAADGSLSALIVTQECARNTMALCGGSQLLAVHLKSLGVARVLAISRNKWRRADPAEQKNIILNRLEALERLRMEEQQQKQRQQQQQQQKPQQQEQHSDQAKEQ